MKSTTLTQEMDDIAMTLARRGYDADEIRAAMREWADAATEKAIAWAEREDTAMARAEVR